MFIDAADLIHYASALSHFYSQQSPKDKPQCVKFIQSVHSIVYSFHYRFMGPGGANTTEFLMRRNKDV